VVHKDIDLAFNVLKETEKIQVNEDPESLMNKAVDLYTKNSVQGVNTLLITSRNEDREELNNRIRSNLKERELLKDGISFNTLKSKSLSATQRVLADNYETQDVLIAHSKTDNGLERGQKYQINEIDIHNNLLKVTSLEGNLELDIDLSKDSKSFQAYSLTDKEFSKNDSIIFTKNDKLEVYDDALHPEKKKDRIKVQNGQSAKIVGHLGSKIYAAVNDSIVSIETDLSKKGSYQHFDYNYAVTEHKSQGATVDHLISYAPTKNINSFNSFYVGVTRAKRDLTVLTDNPSALASQVKKQQSKISTNDFSIQKANVDEVNLPNIDLQSIEKSLENGFKIDPTKMESFIKMPKQLIDNQLKQSFLKEKSPSKIILANTSQQAEKLNQGIRESLKINGKLKNPVILKTLVEQTDPVNITEDTVLESLSYNKEQKLRKGDKLVFQSLNEEGYSFLNKSKNTLHTITDAQLKDYKVNTLVEREIAKGDKIVFSSASKSAAVTENQDAVVLKAGKTQLEVMTKQGIKKIDTNINSRSSVLNIDYAYAKKDINSNYDKVITTINHDSKKSLHNTKKALKHSKRAFETIYSDDKSLHDVFDNDADLLDLEIDESSIVAENIELDSLSYELDYVSDYSSNDFDNIQILFTEFNNEKSQELDINL
jgi:ASC-1-like (ASCH) protein